VEDRQTEEACANTNLVNNFCQTKKLQNYVTVDTHLNFDSIY